MSYTPPDAMLRRINRTLKSAALADLTNPNPTPYRHRAGMGSQAGTGSMQHGGAQQQQADSSRQAQGSTGG